MDTHEVLLASTYYSPRGYWKGLAAVGHLATATGVSEDVPRAWLSKQGLWQIYLPPPRHVPRPRFDVSAPNEVHQADLLFLPHDRPGWGQKLYKYALTIVDVASRFKEAEPLATKKSAEVADALSRIYKRSPLNWPKLLQVDPGREFMGALTPLLEKHGVSVRSSRVDIHRDQALVESWNRTFGERLFGHQYAQEMLLQSRRDSRRSAEWVSRLPAVVAALNGEVTRLIANKSSDAIELAVVAQKPPSVEAGRLRAAVAARPTLCGASRYNRLARSVIKADSPVLYYVDTPNVKRGFVRKELQVVPPDTQHPPDGVLKDRAGRRALRVA
ncbi:hypothetical protein QZH41_009631 [Actinostola sp. cb2023]|nr:hypothetical protein QZH41_009631 [Actinostola sp. cb2023]